MKNDFAGRPEDAALMRGQATFVDDIRLSGMLHAAVFRSSWAAARIQHVDVATASRMSGVKGVYTWRDLGTAWRLAPVVIEPSRDVPLVFHPRTHSPLAREVVRYVGEPLALVVAKSRYAAEDALEKIRLRVEPLEPALDLEKAARVNAPLVHSDLESNLAAHFVQQKGDYDRARQQADRIIRRRMHYDRGAATPIECRGVIAQWDAQARMLSVWASTQVPVQLRDILARWFGLDPSHVTVRAPCVGGAFGSKMMVPYPEEILISWAAIQLGRPVKWIEDRYENFVSSTQERLQIHDAELAVNRDGLVLGVKDVFLHEVGAYNSYGLAVPLNTQGAVLGLYDIKNVFSEFKAIFTHRTPVAPMRGAGRQQGTFVIEKLLDAAARELKLDPVDVRRRNLLRPDMAPSSRSLLNEDFRPFLFDSGNPPDVLQRATEVIGYREFKDKVQQEHRAAGRWVGVGVALYCEVTGVGPREGVRLTLEPDGNLLLCSGFGNQGQGLARGLIRIISQTLGVGAEQVRISFGDSSQWTEGTGTFASRGAIVVGNACLAAAQRFEELWLQIGAGMTLETIARDERLRQRLCAVEYFEPQTGPMALGAHAVILEVDPRTLQVRILKYVVVHDCGMLLDSTIVEGQVHGGVVQGIGNTLFEELLVSPDGHLLNASLWDYAIPTLNDVPWIEVLHVETACPFNRLGVKGAGESGCIPVAAALAQGIEDALSEKNIEVLSIPVTPSKLFAILEHSRQSEKGCHALLAPGMLPP